MSSVIYDEIDFVNQRLGKYLYIFQRLVILFYIKVFHNMISHIVLII